MHYYSSLFFHCFLYFESLRLNIINKKTHNEFIYFMSLGNEKENCTLCFKVK